MRDHQHDYELLFIISPLYSSEEDTAAAINRVQQAITAAGGEVTRVDHSAPWGRRKLAYPIRKYAEGEASRRQFTEGYYVLCYFSLPTSQIGELERSLKLNDAILRYLMTVIEHKGQAVSIGGAVPITTSTIDEDLEDDDEINEEDEAEENEDEE